MKNKKWIQIIILSLLFIIGFYTIANGLFTEKDPIPDIGDRAPNFTLTGLDGEIVSLSDYEGKAIVINFWGTFCPPCVREMPLFQQYYEDYKEQDFVILGVNLHEPRVTVNGFVRDYKLTFPIVLDKSVIRKEYGVIKYPTTLMLNRDGIIIERFEGEVTKKLLDQTFQHILSLKD